MIKAKMPRRKKIMKKLLTLGIIAGTAFGAGTLNGATAPTETIHTTQEDATAFRDEMQASGVITLYEDYYYMEYQREEMGTLYGEMLFTEQDDANGFIYCEI
jgi:hypothetical protein